MSVRTAKIFAILLAAYIALALPAYVGPAFLEEFSSYLVLFTVLSIHIPHRLGIPGLLEHEGACGWGWCAPTVFGWIFLALFWLSVMWLAAWAITRLIARPPRRIMPD
jgi:hypothetical protein